MCLEIYGKFSNTALTRQEAIFRDGQDKELSQTFLTNPSKLTIYLCKIPTVITETLMGKKTLKTAAERTAVFVKTSF
jgi:hypothetical protein